MSLFFHFDESPFCCRTVNIPKHQSLLESNVFKTPPAKMIGRPSFKNVNISDAFLGRDRASYVNDPFVGSGG